MRVSLKAVIFDLDDTLYDHAQFVRGAYGDVATAFARHTGMPSGPFRERLWESWQERTGRCHTLFREALEASGCPAAELEPILVQTYRNHSPRRLEAFPGAAAGLDALRGRVRLGLLSDGQPALQRRKLAALGLASRFDAVLVSGDLGAGVYKPAPELFLEMLRRLDAAPAEALVVGDDPRADLAGAAAAGIPALRVRAGQYRHEASPAPCAEAASLAGALAWITDRLDFPEERR
jgi:putative hydrolase of the HAD superfamily